MKRENQKVILVTGKGGVGKSALASAIALIEAKAGRRVLLAELGERGFFRHIFPGAGESRPVTITAGVDAVRWEPEACLKEYLLHYLKVEKLVDMFFSNRVMRSFVGAAPGLRELALLGKITSGPRGVGPDLPYDVIVVDAFATGHFRALCMAPIGMAEAVRIGPMADQSRMMTDLLKNSKNTRMVVVTLPEELPMNEADELNQFIQQEFSLTPIVVINRNITMPLSQSELDITVSRIGKMDSSLEWLQTFAKYLNEQGARQEGADERVRGWGITPIELPFYFTSDWPTLLREMGQDLEKTWPTG